MSVVRSLGFFNKVQVPTIFQASCFRLAADMVDSKFDQSYITLETLAVLCAGGLPGRWCLA